ncbi:MAG: hypothetical protein ACTMII_01865 [Brachybacterium sp.]|uniref:hypothetical protein n=1 Tax=unclassified Brachybacterium TaxID=2623841 RepID=UPI003F8DCAB3
MTWTGSRSVLAEIRDALIVHSTAGTLRLVLQQLTLRDQGRAVGSHEVIDGIIDVDGNLVVVPIGEAVRADPAASAALDAALARLRAEILAELGAAPDSLEVVMDADRTRRVRIVRSLEVSPAGVVGPPPHPALHDGRHHIVHHAPALDELRDRLAPPPPGLLARLRAVLGRGARRAR